MAADFPKENTHPFGRGLNVPIEVPDIAPLLRNLAAVDHALFLPPEEKGHRINLQETGTRQFVVADPNGDLLRFFSDLGMRAAP